MLDLQACLTTLVRLSATGDPKVLEQVTATVASHLASFGEDRAAQADALYRLIAAFIGRVAPTALSETITERLVEQRGRLLGEDPFVAPQPQDRTVRGLITRLGAAEHTGTHVTAGDLTLILTALRFYRDAGPQP